MTLVCDACNGILRCTSGRKISPETISETYECLECGAEAAALLHSDDRVDQLDGCKAVMREL